MSRDFSPPNNRPSTSKAAVRSRDHHIPNFINHARRIMVHARFLDAAQRPMQVLPLSYSSAAAGISDASTATTSPTFQWDTELLRSRSLADTAADRQHLHHAGGCQRICLCGSSSPWVSRDNPDRACVRLRLAAINRVRIKAAVGSRPTRSPQSCWPQPFWAGRGLLPRLETSPVFCVDYGSIETLLSLAANSGLGSAHDQL